MEYEEHPFFSLKCDKCNKLSDRKEAHILVEEGWNWGVFQYKNGFEEIICLCSSCQKKHPKYISNKSKEILNPPKPQKTLLEVSA